MAKIINKILGLGQGCIQVTNRSDLTYNLIISLTSMNTEAIMAQDAGDRTRKIVYIEDEQPMLELVMLILQTNGFEGVGTRNGPEGLELVASVKPDLVLLDLMMPEMDGWEVYKCMKADEAMQTIPVIIVTAKAQPIDKIMAENIAKVEGYVTKPFTPSELVEAINKVLGISNKDS